MAGELFDDPVATFDSAVATFDGSGLGEGAGSFPTFFGYAISPADGASNSSQSVTVTPPGSMVAGDLVYLIGFADNTFDPDISILTAGGQTWNTVDTTTLNNFGVSIRRFWCEFNGTWGANPVLSQSGPSVDFSALMLVARHGTAGVYWARDQATLSAMSDAIAPFDLVYPTAPLGENYEISFVAWASDVLNTMGLQTSGWTNPGGDTEWQNVSEGSAFGAFDVYDSSVPSGSDHLGTSIALGGVAHTKTAWVQVFASTPFDVNWVTVLFHQTSSGGNDTSTLVDIGTGAAASEVVILPNLMAGYIANFAGKEYNFPIFIPAGTRIAARAQSARTSFTMRCAVILHGATDYAAWTAGTVEAIGINTGTSKGVPVTATQNAEGTWTSIGAPTADTQLLCASIQGNGDTGGLTNANFALDIGSGDPTPTILQENLAIRTLVNEIGGPYPAFIPITREIPSGETIWARMQTHVATDLTLDVGVWAMQE